MIGALRAAGRDPAEVFTGEGYAPPPLTPEEARHVPSPRGRLAALCPARLSGLARGRTSPQPRTGSRTGDGIFSGAARRCTCAPTLARAGREAARAALAEDGIASEPHPPRGDGPRVTANARGIRHSRAYLSGVVELQDAASQAVVEEIGAPAGQGRALDYWAGGRRQGARSRRPRLACHVRMMPNPGAWPNLPDRAARAGVAVEIAGAEALAAQAPFDLVSRRTRPVRAAAHGVGRPGRAGSSTPRGSTRWWPFRMSCSVLRRLMSLRAGGSPMRPVPS